LKGGEKMEGLLKLTTRRLQRISNDYGPKGKGKEELPSEEVIIALAEAAKSVALIVHMKEIEEMAKNSL
jgi:hypothetical protein